MGQQDPSFPLASWDGGQITLRPIPLSSWHRQQFFKIVIELRATTLKPKKLIRNLYVAFSSAFFLLRQKCRKCSHTCIRNRHVHCHFGETKADPGGVFRLRLSRLVRVISGGNYVLHFPVARGNRHEDEGHRCGLSNVLDCPTENRKATAAPVVERHGIFLN